MPELQFPTASVRNSEPILGVLRNELKDSRRLLEIGSGSAYHAIRFATELAHLTWQTSDLEAMHSAIDAAIAANGPSNVMPPFVLDVRHAKLPAGSFDAVYSANTAHIMSFTAAKTMFALVGRSLDVFGKFCYYGPFKRAGLFSTQSNAEFDAALRTGDGDMGIRELEDCDEVAGKAGLVRKRVYAMPANNLLVVWQRQEGKDNDDDS